MKIKKILLILLVVCVLAITIGQISASENNMEISPSNEVGNFTELNNLIQVNDVVDLDKDYKAVEGENQIVVNKDLTINGNDHVIDADGKCRIFVVKNYVILTLKNITLMNGYSEDDGGAIYSTSSINLIFKEGVVFFNNYGLWGGAIYSDNNIYINVENNVNFNNNHAGGYGGAIGIAKGSALGNKVIIKGEGDVSFTNNSASSGGGAIFINGGGIINITGIKNVIFMNNKADKGGAISSYGHVTINAPIINFSNNKASGYGGAIYTHFNVDINGSELHFINNTCVASYGGAIYSKELKIYSYNLFFNNNIANKGGAIYSSRNIFNITNELIFNNNEAFKSGGAIYIDSGGSFFGNINKLYFINNDAIEGEGACIFIMNNLALNVNILVGINNTAFSLYDGASFRTINDYINVNDELIKCSDFGQYYTIYKSIIKIDSKDIEMYYKDGTLFEITLLKNNEPFVNKTVIFTVNGEEYSRVTDKNGKASINIDFNPGNYVIYTKYENIINNNTITIYGKSNLSASDIIVIKDQLIVFTAILKDYAGNYFNNQNINFFVNGEKYNAITDVDGKASINLKLDKGVYNIISSYVGTEYIVGSNSTNKIIVKETIILTANNLTMYYKDGSKFTVELKDGSTPLAGKTIDIILNGNTYQIVTDENGVASMNINLDIGTYSVTANYEDLTSDAIIKVKSTISGDNVTKIYKNGTQYSAKFLDSKGNPLTNTEISFNINGVFYKRTTDNNGIARMNINLNAGEYILTATNPTNGQQYSNTITVLSSIEGEDITKIYKNSTQYKATFYNSDGSLLRNTDIQFNINGVFYTRTTDNNGVATMTINLNVGEYTITAINPINGEMHSNKVTVLPIIIASDLTMKYHDGSKFTAKLIDGSGNPVVGKELKFNVNGVFYYKTTDSNGDAKLTINLNPGEYVITSEYGGFMTSNEIHITE